MLHFRWSHTGRFDHACRFSDGPKSPGQATFPRRIAPFLNLTESQVCPAFFLLSFGEKVRCTIKPYTRTQRLLTGNEYGPRQKTRKPV